MATFWFTISANNCCVNFCKCMCAFRVCECISRWTYFMQCIS